MERQILHPDYSSYQFPFQKSHYSGKVREVYQTKDDYFAMISTNRISAFDVVFPEPIPYKGAVLNLIAAYFLEKTKDICPNWLREVPYPNVSIGVACEPIKVEVIVRGNMCGGLWRKYRDKKPIVWNLPYNLYEITPDIRENDFLPFPIITPTTKAENGHDEDITEEEILSRGLCTKELWSEIEEVAHKLFARGVAMAESRGLILADTKYEFGIWKGKLCLMDEVHTPDSSRYFYAEGFPERQKKGELQKQLSKEFVREWLMERNFMGEEGQVRPELPDEFIKEVSERYIRLYTVLTQKPFPYDEAGAATEEAVYEAVRLSFDRQRLKDKAPEK